MAEPSDRMKRLLKALEIAERCGNTFMAANIHAAIREQSRLDGTPSHIN